MPFLMPGHFFPLFPRSCTSSQSFGQSRESYSKAHPSVNRVLNESRGEKGLVFVNKKLSGGIKNGPRFSALYVVSRKLSRAAALLFSFEDTLYTRQPSGRFNCVELTTQCTSHLTQAWNFLLVSSNYLSRRDLIGHISGLVACQNSLYRTVTVIPSCLYRTCRSWPFGFRDRLRTPVRRAADLFHFGQVISICR